MASSTEPVSITDTTFLMTVILSRGGNITEDCKAAAEKLGVKAEYLR